MDGWWCGATAVCDGPKQNEDPAGEKAALLLLKGQPPLADTPVINHDETVRQFRFVHGVQRPFQEGRHFRLTETAAAKEDHTRGLSAGQRE
jgi:hypothetical protein